MSTAKLQKYFYFGFYYHSVESDSNYIEVIANGKEYCVAEKSNPDMVELLLKSGKEITKERFMEVFEKALSHVNRAYFMEATEPATDEDIREKLNGDQMSELFDRNEPVSEPINSLR